MKTKDFTFQMDWTVILECDWQRWAWINFYFWGTFKYRNWKKTGKRRRPRHRIRRIHRKMTSLTLRKEGRNEIKNREPLPILLVFPFSNPYIIDWFLGKSTFSSLGAHFHIDVHLYDQTTHHNRKSNGQRHRWSINQEFFGRQNTKV